MKKRQNEIINNIVKKIDNVPDDDKELNNLNSKKTEQLIDEEIVSIQNDRKLKNITLIFILFVIGFNILFSFGILIWYPLALLKLKVEIYTQKFLIVLLSSQLIVSPFLLLKIITKHLFPNKNDDK